MYRLDYKALFEKMSSRSFPEGTRGGTKTRLEKATEIEPMLHVNEDKIYLRIHCKIKTGTAPKN